MTYRTAQEVDTKFRELTEPQHSGLGEGSLFNGSYENLDTVIMESANGPYISDVAGHHYLDIGMGAGSLILGHAYPPLIEKVSAQAARGSVFVQPARSAYVLKEKILEHVPDQFTGVVFCNSGSEATMRAIRLARASSEKSRIAIFSGGWHGSHDGVLVADDYTSPEDSPVAKPLSTGIPAQVFTDILMLPYNKSEAFDLIRKEAPNLAVVMIEPVQGSNPKPNMTAFLSELKQVCQQNRVLLAFDESITGYRLCIGGGIQHFDVVPDIITYGKILGGGFPIGAVVFTDTIASLVFGNPEKPFFTGGTFSANPMTMEAGVEVLCCLETFDYKQINDLSDFFRHSCNSYFDEKNLPIRIAGCTSISRLLFTDKEVGNRRARDRYELPFRVQDIFRKLMILNGVLHPSNGLIFFSFAHERNHVEEIIASIKETVGIMQDIDCFQNAEQRSSTYE